MIAATRPASSSPTSRSRCSGTTLRRGCGNIWRGCKPGLRLQLDVPVQVVAPALVEVVGREALAVVLQLPAGRADRRALEMHLGLARGAAAFLKIARSAGGGDILPGRSAALGARHDMVEGQLPVR